jgi:hypothetical protein
VATRLLRWRSIVLIVHTAGQPQRRQRSTVGALLRPHARHDQVKEGMGLTSKVSGGPQLAKPAVDRPLQRSVRPDVEAACPLRMRAHEYRLHMAQRPATATLVK